MLRWAYRYIEKRHNIDISAQPHRSKRCDDLNPYVAHINTSATKRCYGIIWVNLHGSHMWASVCRERYSEYNIFSYRYFFVCGEMRDVAYCLMCYTASAMVVKLKCLLLIQLRLHESVFHFLFAVILSNVRALALWLCARSSRNTNIVFCVVGSII